MDHFNLIASICISAGAIVMAVNMAKFRTVSAILKQISKREHRNLKTFLNLHRFLILLFFLGYLFVLYEINSTRFSMGNLFAGIIFLCGAVFVFLGIILQEKMIRAIGRVYKKSLEANEQLFDNHKKLIQQKNLTHSILDAMSSAIIGIDSNGICNLFNRAAEDFSGISTNDAVGQRYSVLIPELCAFSADIEAVWNGGKKPSPNRLDLTRGTLSRIFLVSFYPLKTEDHPGVAIRMDDITEKVMLEKQLVQSEKMMSIGGIAAGMAHEINNPLAGMIQNAQLAISRLTNDIPTNASLAVELGTNMSAIRTFMEKRGILEQLNRISQTGKRAAKIIDNMLSFSRKSEGKKTQHRITELMDDCLELSKNDFDLKKKYDFKQIRVIKNYAPDLPTANCESGKIQQVFFNLIKNAAQAMVMHPKTGRPPTLDICVTYDSDWIVIAIADNGPGIKNEDLDRIFDPFFTTKEVGEGTGLGLSVSYFIIVNEHGGLLDVSSTDQGTTFIIKLPV